ncbi:MAG: universal stress protein [Deltaproteobacteria bacterium]|nr:MAG: universal stress protein [Deltaproteobacteria bacterium]
MKKIKKIMVALGFTDYAQGTFDYAVTLAEGLGAELFIASVINYKDVDAVGSISSLGYEVNGENYTRGVKEERRKKLQEILDNSPCTKDSIRVVFRTGHPIEELLKLAIEENADLIVMGIKGRTDLRSVLVGSVAEKMFRKSPVPIISYRDEKSARRLRKRIVSE